MYECFPDVDECAVGEDNCHTTLASCTDIVGGSGSFECTCITGYTGDGITCTSMGMNSTTIAITVTTTLLLGINECTTNSDCVENADCIDNGGTFMCMCSNGYSGDGVNSCTSKQRSEYSTKNIC